MASGTPGKQSVKQWWMVKIEFSAKKLPHKYIFQPYDLKITLKWYVVQYCMGLQIFIEKWLGFKITGT